MFDVNERGYIGSERHDLWAFLIFGQDRKTETKRSIETYLRSDFREIFT